MGNGDRAETRLWRTALVYLVAIYASLYPLQFALDLLRERNLLRLAIATAFAAGAAALVALGWRSRWTRRQWSVAALGSLATGAAALRLDVVQERLHLVEYGLLGLLVWAALARRDERRATATPSDRLRTVLSAALLVAAAGWVDEAIQGLLPNRVYDLRDVGINAGAGALAAGLAEIHRRAGVAGRSSE